MNRQRAILGLGLATGIVFCGAIGTRMIFADSSVAPNAPAADVMRSAEENAANGTKQAVNVARHPELNGNPLWAIAATSLSATRERPIFTPSRRPPPAVVAAVPTRFEPAKPVARPAEPERPPLALVGTIIANNESIAVFTDTAMSDVVRLRMEENHAGWILRFVKGREAVLQKDGETAILALPPPGSVTSGDRGLLPPLPQRFPTLLPVRVTAGNPPGTPPRVR
jgi:hypothetical protein